MVDGAPAHRTMPTAAMPPLPRRGVPGRPPAQRWHPGAPVGRSLHSGSAVRPPPDRGDPPRQRAARRRREDLPEWQRRVAALAIVALLLVAGYVAVLVYALSVVDQVDVEVRRLRILSSDADSLEVLIDVRIGNPSAFTVNTGRSTLHVLLDRREAAVMAVPRLILHPGHNDESFRTRIVSVSPGAMRAIAEGLMSEGGVAVNIVGRVDVKGPFGGDFDVSRAVHLGGGEGISVTLDRIALLENAPNGVPVVMDVTVRNPTVLETTLDGLRFDVLHEGEYLHSHRTGGMLLRGDNQMTFRFDIGPGRVDAYRPMISALSGGDAAEVQVVGIMEGDSLLSRLSTAYDRTIGEAGGLGGMDDIAVAIVDAEVDVTGAGIAVAAALEIDNPTPLESTLEGLNFSLSFDGAPLATVGTGGRLGRGTTRLNITFEVPSTASAALQDALAGALAGGPLSLTVAGADLNGLPLSRLMTSFEYEFAPALGGGLAIDVVDADVSLGLLFTSVTATVEVDNPTNVTFDIGDVRLDAYYLGDHVGQVLLDRKAIVPGVQTVGATVSVGTVSLIFLPAWAVDFLAGREMGVLIVATLDFDDGNSLRIERTVTVNG